MPWLHIFEFPKCKFFISILDSTNRNFVEQSKMKGKSTSIDELKLILENSAAAVMRIIAYYLYFELISTETEIL